MKRQFLMPSAMGIVLMLCLLTVQASLLRGVSTISSGASVVQTIYTYGLPTLVETRHVELAGRHVHMYWDRIAASLVVAWCLCMPIGRWITGYEKTNGEFAGPLRTGWSQPAAIVGCVVAGCIIPAIITGYVLSRYAPFSEPAVLMFELLLLMMMLAVPVTVIVMIVRRWRQRMRVLRGFPVEFPAAPV